MSTSTTGAFRVRTRNIRGLRGLEAEFNDFFDRRALDLMFLQEVILFKTSNYYYRRIKHPNALVPAEKVPLHSLGVIYWEGLQVEVEVGVPDGCLFMLVRDRERILLKVNGYCSPNLPDSLTKIHAAIRW